jgi:tRNA/rRNA methyltransferase
MRTRFILIETSHPGNVGAAARALKVMGFDEMVLVAPRYANILRKEETIQRASGANDVLDKTRIVDTLEEACEGISHLCATAMTPRDFGPPTRSPREHFEGLLGRSLAQAQMDAFKADEPKPKEAISSMGIFVWLRTLWHDKRGCLQVPCGFVYSHQSDVWLFEFGCSHSIGGL